MSVTLSERLPTYETLDSVIIDPPERSHTRLDGELPFHVDGFHWYFLTEMTPRIPPLTRATIVGVRGGEIILRGVFNGSYIIEEICAIFVTPDGEQ